jgi:hypothetical protein
VLCRYVAQVFSEWFWSGSICPYYSWYHFWVCISHELYLYYMVFINIIIIDLQLME